MSFYRSDPINYYKLVLPRQSAWEIMNRLGQEKIIHIIPSQTAVLSRPFISHVRRCQDSLNRIHNIENMLQDRNIYQHRSEFPQQAYAELYRLWVKQYEKSGAHPANVLNNVIADVDHTWTYHQDLTKRTEILSTKMQAYRDNLAIIHAGEMKFGRSFFTHREQRFQQLGRGLLQGSKMNFKCGVLNVDEQLRFKRTVFRITKGNSLVSCVPFRELFPNITIPEEAKVAFFVLFPGRSDSYLDRKLQKLMQSYNSQSKYELPNNEGQFDTMIKSLEMGFNETQNLLNLTQIEITSYLQKFCEPMPQSQFFRHHQYLKLYIMKEKQLYSNLNQMEFFNNFLQGKIYVRTQDIQRLQQILTQLQNQVKLPSGQLVFSSTDKYPTHFVRNQFTRSAHEIVETYGVARYQEANPSFFTVITFPFLFGVMFGDIGHGSILFAFGLYLVFWKQTITNPLIRMLLPHRYILTLMGFFAIYCGFIYNDYLSMSLDLFGSCYKTEGITAGNPALRSENCVYPFGLDPVWSVSETYLNFVNSLKMKISVIIGVLHMTLGVLVKASNSLYFKKYLDFFFEFIPQLTFLILLFGYMDFLIIYKWTVAWELYDPDAPSIITTMINMPLKMGRTTDCCGGQPMWGQFGDTSQDVIQKWFVVAAIICIPLMLLPKPLYEIYCQNHKSQDKESRLLGSSQNLEDMNQQKSNLHAIPKVDQHSSDQIFVHQLIETIEYVLGCISNTASYLRLWALSLAHSQLSDVFFQYLVEGGLIKGFAGIPAQLIGFVFLAGITFGVLLCMDSLECFLHTLRLHWVQFNNKFYKGDGFVFMFYSFSDRMSQQLLLIV